MTTLLWDFDPSGYPERPTLPDPNGNGSGG